MSASGSTVDSLFDRASNTTIAGAITTAVGVFILAPVRAFAEIVFAVSGVLTDPVGALTNAASALINAIFGGAAYIIGEGAATSARNLGIFGAVAFIVAIAIVLGALWLVNAYVSEESTGNIIPGIPFDIPTPGFGGPEEEDE